MQSSNSVEALHFFNKAISLDPDLADAYRHRGDILTADGRIVEGNADLEKAKALRSGKRITSKKKRTIAKINLQETDNIVDQLFPHDIDDDGEDPIEFDNQIYDYIFSDDVLESDNLLTGLADTQPQASTSPAILEFDGGARVEMFSAQLFYPSAEEITVREKSSDEETRVINLKELSCIRLARQPLDCVQDRKASCQIEIIETRDGNVYHEYIPQDQPLVGLLLTYSTKENTNFPFTFFPEVNIKSRSQQRFLGDILLEKEFIAEDILKSALEEHQHLKKMQIGRIISRQANIQQSLVETTLANAERSGLQGMKTGEILIESGLVTEEQVYDALEFQETLQRQKLGGFLVDKGVLREKELYVSLAEKFRIPYIDLRQQKVSRNVLKLLPRELVLRYSILPLDFKGSILVVASPTPDVLTVIDAIRQHDPQLQIEFVLTRPTHLRNVVKVLYRDRRRPASLE